MKTRKNRTPGRRRIEKLARALGRGPAGFERLEDRTMLTAVPLIVRNTNDSGPDSLRWAIELANSDAEPDTITFAIPDADPVIYLAHGLTILELNGRFPADADLDAAWEQGLDAFRARLP